MNSKQQSTLDDIFRDPVLSSIPWTDIERLFVALGARISEGNGSRIRVSLNGRLATYHRPHPQKETDKGCVKSVRRFLTGAGVVKTD
ncbi:MAG: type II toxin-antitoxin system HicA family toxin [Rhodospirillaceae bacterium]|nr:type II toxin-antitoxin system HicA family toxin [Rhodospirillales bacterium]